LSTESGSVPPPTAHAIEQYTPPPARLRSGIALCLSGGGFRATLFHLGATCRLNELGLLSQVNTITSVSGGSILAAHLATSIPWPLRGPFSDWDTAVAQPMRRFAGRNIRTPAILKRFLPWNWLRTSTGAEALAATYQRRLTSALLTDLPGAPAFVFCSTDMVWGVNWIFEKARLGDYQAGYAQPPSGYRLARAVAASSCFPPVFNPLPIQLQPAQLVGGLAPPGPERDAFIRGLRLTDGGNYDNLGLEPVWKSHAVVLCSDGGGTFDFKPDTGILRRLSRYLAIVDNQARALRRRWLIASFIDGEMQGTYWGIGSATESYEIPTSPAYSKEFASRVIAKIRTDLDAFSTTEASVLENHGYLLADAAIKRHLPHLLPANPPPLRLPHRWLPEADAESALRDSGRRLLLGRWSSAE
jgi:NTE family protein